MSLKAEMIFLFACLFLRWEEPISSLLAVAFYHKQIQQFGS